MKPLFYILNHSKIVDHVGWYQGKWRCYLDEYPEQKELREEWKWQWKRMGLYIIQDNGIDRYEDKRDTYFERRWLRRN